MDSRYTNREKFLDSLSDEKIADLISDATYDNHNSYEMYCRKYCQLYETKRCAFFYDGMTCRDAIEKWLGEYSDD